MKRRGFLKFLGGTAAGITLGELGFFAMGPRSDPSFSGLHHDGLHVEENPLSVCGGCAAGCSVRLRVVDGRLVGIRGNPSCPISSGGLCSRGASEVEAFYDPDRLLGPVQRAGPGAPLTPVAWGEALGTISAAVEKARAGSGPIRVGTVLASGLGLTHAVIEAFHAELGTPHVYRQSTLRDPAAEATAALSLGAPEGHGYDLGRASLILSIDTPLLEGLLSPCHVARLFGAQRQASEPLELIHIGSRLSTTGMRADRWIQCKPGTEIVLALGIARVILREGLASARALSHIEGLDPWRDEAGQEHAGFGKALSYAYSTQSVSRQTGVPVVTILDLARHFARARAPLAIGERLAGSAGVFGLAAVGLLNALVDQVGARRTVVPRNPSPLLRLTSAEAPSAPLTRPPVVALPGGSIWATLAGLQAEGGEPPFDLLFLEEGTALGDLREGDSAWEMLKRIPLIVSFSRSLDAATELAHLVLPATTNYEQPIFTEAEPASALQAVAVAPAAMAPLVDARPIAAVFLDLAGRSKLPLADRYSNTRAVVDDQIDRLGKLRRGTPYTGAFHHRWIEEQERAGWWSPSAETPAGFETSILEGGGWLDPVAPEIPRLTTRRFRVSGMALEEWAAPSQLFALPANDDAWSPHDEFASHGNESVPGAFHLVPFTVAGFVGQGTPNRPSLLEHAGPSVLGAYTPWAEFNIRDGEALQIEEGDALRLVSEHGSATFTARLTALVAEGTVAVPWGGCVRGQGRFARDWGQGAEPLANGQRGALGFPTISGTRVRVERVKRGEG